MKIPSVRLKIRVRLDDGKYPYLDPVFGNNGKLKPHYAAVDGKPEHHPEGVYYLRYTLDGKPVFRSAGSDPQLAMLEKLKTERALSAQAVGVSVEGFGTEPKRTPLDQVVSEYLLEVSAHKSKKTFDAYSLALRLFRQSCAHKHLEELDGNRTVVLGFMTHLRQQGDGPRTVANRVDFLRTFFLHRGLKWPLAKSDKPKYTEKMVSAYSEEELRGIMQAASRDQYELFQFLLCTGAREQEAQYATYQDLDFRAKTFNVTEKLDLGFRPKDSEEGAVPVPDSLLDLLKERRKRNPTARLIFPTDAGKPDGHLLRILKRVAFRAGLNCLFCVNKQGKCCSEGPVCKRWELHRFRKTFATYHHENGVPARTIQRWLRHSDLHTTLSYLAGSDDKSVRTREQVNGTFRGVAA
jgi:integrase/recombinase XerD